MASNTLRWKNCLAYKRLILLPFLFIYFNTKENVVAPVEFQLPFSYSNLVFYLQSCDIKHPDIVLAQMLLETGNFQSAIFCENNNLTGMKVPRKRATTATGSNRGHAMYPHWTASVMDYKLYQQKFCGGDYYSFLSKSKYAEDTLYTRKVRRIARQLQ